MKWLIIILMMVSPKLLGETHVKMVDLYLYIVKPIPIIRYSGFGLYKQILGQAESGNCDTLTNGGGHRGRYQFSRKTIEGLGMCYDSLVFKEYSDKALSKLMVDNWRLLGSHWEYAKDKDKKSYLRKSKNYHKYVGNIIAGIKITKAGMLAAAHLKGWTYVKIFIDSGGALDGWDGNDMHVSSYFKMMENVKLD